MCKFETWKEGLTKYRYVFSNLSRTLVAWYALWDLFWKLYLFPKNYQYYSPNCTLSEPQQNLYGIKKRNGKTVQYSPSLFFFCMGNETIKF